MISDFLKKSFLSEFKHISSQDQERLFDLLSLYITDRNPDSVFLLKGYAGTGKTSAISAVVKALEKNKINSILLAPTGRAAKVFSHYSEHQAYTVHKKIYRQKSSSDGFGNFVLDRNLHKDTLFIVDEASMISDSSQENSIFGTGRLLDDLIEYVYTGNNCKLILIGDTAQLPPVGLNLSPALEKDALEKYNLSVVEILLSEVVRQKKKSGILKNATELRQSLDTNQIISKVPHFKINSTDVMRISGEDLIETISSSYHKYGLDSVIVVNRSNKRANKYNQGIRNSILGRESEIAQGDYIMVVKNNYFWAEKTPEIDFIANGDIARIQKIKGYQELYGFRFADLTIRLLDYNNIELDVKVILDTLIIESASLGAEDNKRLYYAVLEDYADISNKKDKTKKIRIDPYFNALQIKFAYAITCHKAQGGQWQIVFLDQGYFTDDMINREYLRWLYTAFTRSVEKIYLVNFPDNFFD
jgi:exodeoxyribonuclease V